MYAMLVLRGPHGRLVIPSESPSENKLCTYLHYLLSRTLICLDHLDSVKCHNSE